MLLMHWIILGSSHSQIRRSWVKVIMLSLALRFSFSAFINKANGHLQFLRIYGMNHSSMGLKLDCMSEKKTKAGGCCCCLLLVAALLLVNAGLLLRVAACLLCWWLQLLQLPWLLSASGLLLPICSRLNYTQSIIGKPTEQIETDVRLAKYFSPSEAVEYGIIDKAK